MRHWIAAELRHWARKLDGRRCIEIPNGADVSVTIGAGIVTVTARGPNADLTVPAPARVTTIGGGGGGAGVYTARGGQGTSGPGWSCRCPWEHRVNVMTRPVAVPGPHHLTGCPRWLSSIPAQFDEHR